MNKIRRLLESRNKEDQLIAIELLYNIPDEDVPHIVDHGRSEFCKNFSGVYGIILKGSRLILLGSNTIVWWDIERLNYWNRGNNNYEILNNEDIKD